jgi:hypothetical protein
MMPLVRREGLYVERLGDEVLVVDGERQRVHCLSRLAAQVWELCDGAMGPGAMASRLKGREVNLVSEDLVALALHCLQAADLLARPDAQSAEPAPGQELAHRRRQDRPSFREPMITSVTLETVSHAESSAPCSGIGEQCGVAQPPCCPGLTCHLEGRQTSGQCRP